MKCNDKSHDPLLQELKRRRISRRQFIRAGLVAAGGVVAAQPLLSACAPKTETTTASGEIIYVSGDHFECLDPHDHNGLLQMMVCQNTLGTLVAKDSKGAIVPNLATEWKAIGPTAWEFKLREGAKFVNGEPCDAEAIAATFTRLLSTGTWGTQRQWGQWKVFKGTEVVDKYTVRVLTLTMLD